MAAQGTCVLVASGDRADSREIRCPAFRRERIPRVALPGVSWCGVSPGEAKLHRPSRPAAMSEGGVLVPPAPAFPEGTELRSGPLGRGRREVAAKTHPLAPGPHKGMGTDGDRSVAGAPRIPRVSGCARTLGPARSGRPLQRRCPETCPVPGITRRGHTWDGEEPRAAEGRGRGAAQPSSTHPRCPPRCSRDRCLE